MQPHLLLKRLLDLQVNSTLVLWIRAFLSDRPQRVSIRGCVPIAANGYMPEGVRMSVESAGTYFSDELVLNTGAPQGCVLSPVLFSVYTNEIMRNTDTLTLVKYADDMALSARLRDEHSLAHYFDYVSILVTWFDDSFLELSVPKTKEMCFSSAQALDSVSASSKPLVINGENVDTVASFKYLGTVLDQNLSFNENVNQVHKKAQQRLYLLRKLRSFNVSTGILMTVYKSLVESVLTFNLVSWYESLTVKNKAKLARVVNQASRIVGVKQAQLSDLYSQALRRKAVQILGDSHHPLNGAFQFLPSGRRLRVPFARTKMYKRSFVPSAVNVLNVLNS